MLSCRQASVLVSLSLQRPLTRKERWLLMLHLAICKACRRFRAQWMAIHALLKKQRTQVEQDSTVTLSAQARERIQRALDTSDS